MKRSFSLINVFSLSLLVLSGWIWNGMTGVSAQDDSVTQGLCDGYRLNADQLTEDIFEAASVNVNIQFADIFGGTPKKPEIKNLYLNIYKMVKQEPADDALKATAEEYQYTQTEMCAILGGSLSLVAMTYEENLDVNEINEIISEIQETYQKNFNDAQEEQEMFLDSYSKEIFANGDTGDSSFDVLYDLEIIEYLLFGEDGYSTGSDDASDSGDDEDEDEEEASGDEETETSTDSEVTSTETETTTESSEEETEDPSAEEEVTTDEEEPLNPAACNADAGLQAALADIAPAESDETEALTENEDENTTPEIDEDETVEVDEGDLTSVEKAEERIAESTLVAATPSDWTRPELCGEIFCLFVNFINHPETSYQTSDNCIKCHLDYIVKTLDETVSKGLIPGKVSGNLMEPAICKKEFVASLSLIDLNFIAIPMPLSTPPADDLVTGLNFCDEMGDFIDEEENYDLLVRELFKDTCGADGESSSELTEEQKYEIEKFGEELNRRMKAVNMRSDDNATLDEILEQAVADHQEELLRFEASFENSRTHAQFGAQTDFFEAMSYEMDQMNNYFLSFQKSISLTQGVAEKLRIKLKAAKSQ